MTTNRYNFQIEVAVLVSVLLHALTFGVYQTRAFWEQMPLVRSLAVSRPQAAPQTPVVPRITFVEAPAPKPQRPPQPPEQPNIYMETHENQAAATPPADTDFYGTRSTVAANPENPTKKEGETPYLEGEKTGALASDTVPFAKPTLMPPPAPPPVAAAPPKPAAPAERGAPEPPAEKPKEVPNEGLAQAEPPKPERPKFAMLGNQEPGMMTPPAPAPTPRPPLSPGRAGGEVATVRSRLTASGVSRQGVTAFNVAESPFGAYDREIIRAVQSRWYNILDQFGLDTKGGTVTLYFELYDDGRIANLQRKENTAGEMNALWCEKAVTEAAPFEPLPDKLRLLLGGQPRDVTFTFYY